jgi:hypothetical protein
MLVVMAKVKRYSDNFLGRGGALDVSSLKDLEKVLKDLGYSDKAASEILKWYKNTDNR